MSRAWEAVTFGGLAIGLHVVALSALPAQPSGGAPAREGSAIAVSAPDAALRSLVEAWDAPPRVMESIPAPTPPEAPQSRARKVAALAVPPAPPPAAPIVADPRSPEMPRDPAARPPAARPKARPFAANPATEKGSAGQTRATAAPPAPESSSAALKDALTTAVREALSRARFYPARARDRGLTGTTVLDVTIARDGRLIDARVARGSGSDLLDRASVEAARRAAFPAAPAELRDARFLFRLGLVYNLE